jgi:hypothetical protein
VIAFLYLSSLHDDDEGEREDEDVEMKDAWEEK